MDGIVAYARGMARSIVESTAPEVCMNPAEVIAYLNALVDEIELALDELGAPRKKG